jgi:hypothetical protein
VDVTASLDAPCPPDDLFAAVEDLGAYPSWLGIVTRAEVDAADPAGGDPGPAWTVDLRGRLGPLARSKRLRMVRTAHEAPGHIRFERRELDGRSHSAWVLDAEVAPVDPTDDSTAHPAAEPDVASAQDADGGSRLTMRLHYGGSFGGSLLERMLRDEIEQSRPKLLDRVSGRGPTSDPPRD